MSMKITSRKNDRIRLSAGSDLRLVAAGCASRPADPLARGFAAPPDEARPWVYWMWMDGNLTARASPRTSRR